MPITKDFQNKKHYFIFCGKAVAVSSSSEQSQGEFTLPNEAFFNEFISAQKDAGNLCDVISEMPQDYAVAIISGNSSRQQAAAEESRGEDYDFIPLREFCFNTPSIAAIACRAKGIATWHETYRHCPKCGAVFGDDKIETALLCSACNFKLYPRIEPCVIVLIHRGDEILLVKNKHSGARFYSCIAGFIELGETAIDAVRRETKEEVGLELKNIRTLGTQSWPFPDQLMLAFSADYASGELVLQEDEIAEARWFKKDALPAKEELPGQGSVAWNMIFNQI